MLGKRISPATYAKVRPLYDSGLSCVDIESVLGIGHSSAQRELIRSGLDRLRRTYPKPGCEYGRWNCRHSLDEHAFDAITPEAAYWLGFLFADGHVNVTRHLLYVALKSSDSAHLERLRRFLGSTVGIKTKATPENGSVRASEHCFLQVYSRRLAERLDTYGIAFPKDAEKLPSTLLESANFWRGAVDGDGTLGIYRYPNRVIDHISLVGTLGLMSRFRAFCSTVVGAVSEPRCLGKIWIVKFDHRKARRMAAVLYGSTPHLERKAAIAKRMLEERGI